MHKCTFSLLSNVCFRKKKIILMAFAKKKTKKKSTNDFEEEEEDDADDQRQKKKTKTTKKDDDDDDDDEKTKKTRTKRTKVALLKNILICGTPGTGKSTLAKLVLEKVNNNNNNKRICYEYVNVGDVCKAKNSTIRSTRD